MKKEGSFLKSYDVQFSGLKMGLHDFEFTLNNAFFSYYNYQDITGADILCKVNLEKKTTMLIFHFSHKGTVQSICDRCGESLTLPVELEKQQVIVKFGNENSVTTDDLITITEGSHTINIADFLYEFVVLSLPLHKSHEVNECNKEVIAILNKLKAKEETPDPRWSALQNIKSE